MRIFRVKVVQETADQRPFQILRALPVHSCTDPIDEWLTTAPEGMYGPGSKFSCSTCGSIVRLGEVDGERTWTFIHNARFYR